LSHLQIVYLVDARALGVDVRFFADSRTSGVFAGNITTVLVRRYPADLDVQALYVEGIMNVKFVLL
jgi:hypothetical protein